MYENWLASEEIDLQHYQPLPALDYVALLFEVPRPLKTVEGDKYEVERVEGETSSFIDVVNAYKDISHHHLSNPIAMKTTLTYQKAASILRASASE